MGALGDAIRRVRARPRLLLAVAGLHVAVALLASGPLSATLKPLLDGRPAAAGMMRGDDGLTIELLADHPEILRVAGASAQASALLYALVSWILVGGLLAALTRDGGDDGEARGAVAVAQACARHAGRMVRVGLLGVPLRLLPIGVGVGAWFAIGTVAHGGGLTQVVARAAATALLFGGAWSLTTVAVDYARGVAFADGELPAWRAVARGWKRSLGHFGPAARLAAFSGFGFALSTGAYLAIALALPNEPAWSLAVLMLLRLALVVVRAFFSVSTLAAAALQVAAPAAHQSSVISAG